MRALAGRCMAESGIKVGLLLGALFLLTSATGCKQRLTAEEAKGAALYQVNCAPCHEETPEGLLKTPPKLKGIFHAATLPDGVPATDEALQAVIVQGVRTMPAFDGRLREEQVRAIVAYLHVKN